MAPNGPFSRAKPCPLAEVKRTRRCWHGCFRPKWTLSGPSTHEAAYFRLALSDAISFARHRKPLRVTLLLR
jgi:hypothetical protein